MAGGLIAAPPLPPASLSLFRLGLPSVGGRCACVAVAAGSLVAPSGAAFRWSSRSACGRRCCRRRSIRLGLRRGGLVSSLPLVFFPLPAPPGRRVVGPFSVPFSVRQMPGSTTCRSALSIRACLQPLPPLHCGPCAVAPGQSQVINPPSASNKW